MKLKTIYKLFTITFVAILAFSCNDNLDQIGFSIQPDKDRLTVGIDTLQLQARTVQVDSVLVKLITLYLENMPIRYSVLLSLNI